MGASSDPVSEDHRKRTVGTAQLTIPLFNSYLIQDPACGIAPLPVNLPRKHPTDTPGAVPQYTPLKFGNKSFWVTMLQSL